MLMLKWLKSWDQAGRQTKYLILMYAIYLLAIVWTTVQAYARLSYSRTGTERPLMSEPK